METPNHTIEFRFTNDPLGVRRNALELDARLRADLNIPGGNGAFAHNWDKLVPPLLDISDCSYAAILEGMPLPEVSVKIIEWFRDNTIATVRELSIEEQAALAAAQLLNQLKRF